MRHLLVVAALAGLLAGCSALSSSPTTTQSLAQAQAAVNAAQAAVAQDEVNEQALTNPNTPQFQQCINDPATPDCIAYANQLNAEGRKLDAKLAMDKFKLQVAQDQLKEDEG
jgi:Tfp pilus assembly protein PilX